MENILIQPSLKLLSAEEVSPEKREIEFNKIMQIMYNFYMRCNYLDEEDKEFAENSEEQVRNKLIEIMENSSVSASYSNIANQVMSLINQAIEKLENVSDIKSIPANNKSENVSDIKSVLANRRMSTYLSSVRDQMKEVQYTQKSNPYIITPPRTDEQREEDTWYRVQSPGKTGDIPNFFDEPRGDVDEPRGDGR